MHTILMSVALPLWKAGDIFWLAMESLCRQEGVDFAWELLVCEEAEDGVGIKAIEEYRDRLEKVGCRRIAYESLSEHVALSYKWYRLAEMRNERSELFLLQAADCYSHKHRLANTWRTYESTGADWIQWSKGYFYDIGSGIKALYDHSTIGDRHPCALNMAIATKLLKNLYPEGQVYSSVDYWLYITCKPSCVIWNTLNHEKGVDTNGLNKISKRRFSMMRFATPPFREITEEDPAMDIPADIMERLEDLKDEAEQYDDTDVPLQGVSIGIVKSREDLWRRAYNSVMRLIYPTEIRVIECDNFDKKKSIAGCYNEIIAKCETPYLGFIGDDDFVMPDYIITLMSLRMMAIQSGDDPDCLTSFLTLSDGAMDYRYEALAPGIWKTRYLKQYPFDEKVKVKVTADYFYKASERKSVMATANWYFGYYYWQHQGNHSGNKLEQVKEQLLKEKK